MELISLLSIVRVFTIAITSLSRWSWCIYSWFGPFPCFVTNAYNEFNENLLLETYSWLMSQKRGRKVVMCLEQLEFRTWIASPSTISEGRQSYRNQSWNANYLTGFYMTGTLIVNGLEKLFRTLDLCVESDKNKIKMTPWWFLRYYIWF